MMAMIVMVTIVAYMAVVGSCRALFHRLYPDDYSEDFSYLLAFTWPLSLPAVGAHIAMKRAIGHVDAKRAALEKEAAELRKRVEDLERDLDCERTP